MNSSVNRRECNTLTGAAPLQTVTVTLFVRQLLKVPGECGCGVGGFLARLKGGSVMPKVNRHEKVRLVTFDCFGILCRRGS